MKIIMVHSYKGGSGKTTFSVNAANSLVQDHDQKVLLIESDFIMPSLTSAFSQFAPDVFLNDYLNQEGNDLSGYIYPDTDSQMGVIFCNENFEVHDKVHSSDENWFLSRRRQLAIGLRESDYDYVIFDTSPGLHLFTINILSLTNSIFVVMRPDLGSYRGLDALLNQIYSNAIRLTGKKFFDFQLVFNQIPPVDEMKQVLENWKSELTVKYSFIDNYIEIDYDPFAAYFTATNNYILQEDNQTRMKISENVRRFIV